MELKLSSSLKIAALAAALASGVSAFAADPAPAALQTYQAVVLGDAHAQRDTAHLAPAGSIKPGPYAQYLIHTGQDQASAVAAARRRGETPAHSDDAAPQPERRLNAVELYQRMVRNG